MLHTFTLSMIVNDMAFLCHLYVIYRMKQGKVTLIEEIQYTCMHY